MSDRAYRYVATSRAGFIQQLAVSYIANGYFFYVIGSVPESKDPSAVDRKLIERYGINISKWSRARRKKAGVANVQYLRYGRVFVLIATSGEHRFFVEESAVIRDVRREPLKVFGYAMAHRGGHAHVRIERGTYKELQHRILRMAISQSAEVLGRTIARLPFEPYAPVRRQALRLVRAVNERRRQAGLTSVSTDAVRMKRQITQPFNAAPRSSHWCADPYGVRANGNTTPQ